MALKSSGSIGSSEYTRFIMLIYNHVLRKLGNARISNSKLLIDKNTLYILLAVRRSVEVSKHKNKLVIDINGDNIVCLLIDYDRCIAVFFTLKTIILVG